MANYTNEIQEMILKISKNIIAEDRCGFYCSRIGEGFGLLEIMTMRMIGSKKCSIKDIVRYFNINRNVVNTVVRTLIKNHIVTKDKNEDDGRFQTLSLTPRGEELLKEICDEQRREIEYMLRDTSINEEKAILGFLSRYLEFKEQ